MNLFGTILILFPMNELVKGLTCPGGVFVSVGTKKFYTTTLKVAWQDAKNACPTGTTPATFQTIDEYEQLKIRSENENRRYWTALKIPTTTTVCSGAACDNQLKWDGYGYPFESGSMPVELNVVSDLGKRCLVLDKDKLVQAECSGVKLFYVICQCDPTACLSPSPVETELINDHHYHQNDNIHDFQSAVEYCEEIQFKIASVDTDEGYSNVAQFTREGGSHTSSTWLDLHNPNTIACSSPQDCDLKYQTTSGVAVSTNHLSTLAFDGKAESCVTYSPQKTRMRAERCNADRRVVCQYACATYCPETHPYAYSNGASCCNANSDCTGPTGGVSSFDVGNSCCNGSPLACSDGKTNCQNTVVNGGWSDWVDTTVCSSTCDGGNIQQIRTCDNPEPANGGQTCQGSSSKFTGPSCNTDPCPQNGAWSEWADVGSCSVTCGNGQKTQQRTCTNPAPLHGGLDCPDDDTQQVACNLGDCPSPVDGSWCSWQNTLSECPITCGGTGGGMPQTRSCDCPAKANGGAECVGDSTRNGDCGTDPCPAAYEDWGDWSVCSRTCDYGTRVRSRTCNPEGACDTLGPASEVEYCLDAECPANVAIGTYMAPYGLTSIAKTEFLTNSEAIEVPSNVASPNVFCQHKCLAKRNSRDDYESCNGFIYEDNQCKMKYMAPEWIVEQSKNPGSSSIAYFDVIIP